MPENSSYPFGRVIWSVLEDWASPVAIEVFEMEKGTSFPLTLRN